MKHPHRGAPLAAAVIAAACCLAGPALAQGRGERAEHHGGEHFGERAPLRLDRRHGHDHYYPAAGELVDVLPGGSIGVSYGGGRYYFHAGAWFRPYGSRFLVTVPPVGIIVPVLPPSYVTLSTGGGPYYYANGLYYAAVPGQGYAVVAPPPGVEGPPAGQQAPAAPPPPPPAPAAAPGSVPQPVVYPRSGQSAAQTEADRRECNRWAAAQEGAIADAEVFQRATAACLEGRGYTVR